MLKILFVFAIFMACIQFTAAQEEGRLFRFPAIYNDQLVFSYAGDLYTVTKSGGVARKLTNDDGYEMFARFSPDGKNIAFTGQYDGNTEVYLIPSTGGIPKRLTYTATLGRDDISDRMGPNNIVMTWRDNESIIFRSRKKTFNSFTGQLFVAKTTGGLQEELPFPTGGFCSYSPDQTKLAFNRVFREFRTWKYYKGGMADDVWIYDFRTKEIINITDNDAQDIFPMWHNDKIYFLSDRDRIMNLFVYDINTKQISKVTQYDDYDIKFPSLGKDAITFEKGGFIYVFDLITQKIDKVSITISDDFLTSRPVLKDVSKNINSWAVSPDGKRIALGARGDIYTVPATTGITRNLTQSSGVHDRNVEWSPKGEYISFISDRTGEDEIYITKQDGTQSPVQVTSNSDTYKYNPAWSPDGKKLLWGDKMQRLQYVDIDTKKVTQVDYSPDGEFFDFAWSPDSKWIAYSKPVKEEMNRIYIFNLATSETKPVTDGWYASGNPAFSNDGKYLFFSSSRDFNPVYSWTEWNHAYVDMNKVYFVTLNQTVENPLRPVNDETAQTTGTKAESKTEANTEGLTGAVNVTIDFDGIIERIIALPVKAGAYWNISAVGDNVYYMMNTSSDRQSSLMTFDLKEKKETKVGDFNGYVITADQKKMLVNREGKYAVINLPKGEAKPDTYADLSNMKTWVNLKEEWDQIFNECWRQMRDFFYDPGMHQVNWKQVHDKYAPLVPYANNRYDLTYIIGEMIGELTTGHSYVGGGDRVVPEKIKTGLLGAELIKDASGYYKINRILKGENWVESYRSPLTETGMKVKEGNYIISVNGKDCRDMVDIYESLVNTAGKQVELTLNSIADEKGSWKQIVVPIDDESNLYYYNWVQNNIRKVNEATDGQIGYIHIPDMSAEGLNEFVKHYYPQVKKRGLIIDDRGNGGGNVSPMIIERLRRELTHMGMGRNMSPSTVPDAMVLGPKVMLIDNYSASDGDLFPYQFKTLKLGKIIGVRSWGGVVGIRGSLPLIDGGFLNKPEFAHYDKEGKDYIIEGHGVDPDILIDNNPVKEYEGVDEQLNKAIEVILEELKNYPESWPGIPPFPDKSK